MKGEPYHYNQRKAQRLAQGDDAEADTAVEDKKDQAAEDKMAEADEKAKKAEANAKVKKIEPAEKVSVLESKICHDHTTFYDKKAPKLADLVALQDSVPGYEDVSAEAEKVSILDQGQVTESNSPTVFPQPYRTAFYVQIDDDMGLW